MEAAIADTVAGVGKAKNIYNKEDNPKKSDLHTGILNNVAPLSCPLDMYRIGYCSGSGLGKEHINTKEASLKIHTSQK
jgi:hypothetical protein